MKKMVVYLLMCIALLVGCSSDNSTTQEEPNQNPASPEEQQEVNPTVLDDEPQEANPTVPDDEPQETVVLDDDFVKVTYEEVFEADGIEGTFYFRLTVENKTEKNVTIYLADASVNKVSTLAMSGIPMTIQPGGKSLNPFIFSYSNLDIEKLEDLEEISFKVKVEDSETYDEINTSDIVSVTF